MPAVRRRDWHHAPDSCTLEVFRVSPEREVTHFYLALFKILFLHFKNEIDTGIYEREFMNGNNV